VLLAEGTIVRVHDISILHPGQNQAPLTQDGGNGDHKKSMSTLALSERDMILEALKKNDWIQKEAAHALGISKRVIHYKIRKYGITHPRWIKNR
jgi:transcriptional regulator with GAF, ATPase, and Fis domain